MACFGSDEAPSRPARHWLWLIREELPALVLRELGPPLNPLPLELACVKTSTYFDDVVFTRPYVISS